MRFSASNAARGRNSPIRAHQINLPRSLIDRSINRFANVSQLFGFPVGTAAKASSVPGKTHNATPTSSRAAKPASAGILSRWRWAPERLLRVIDEFDGRYAQLFWLSGSRFKSLLSIQNRPPSGRPIACGVRISLNVQLFPGPFPLPRNPAAREFGGT
jgi:hypothetical protein